MRSKIPLAVTLVLALLGGGCGPGMAKVKGKIVENGQPKTFPAFQASVQFVQVGEDGRPDPNKLYSAIVSEDGSFELVASGGELPAGTCQVIFEVVTRPGGKPAANPFAAPNSPIRRELKSGANDITIDLAKPEG